MTTVAALALLFAGTASPTADVTLAWLVIEPWAWGVTTIETVALAPLAIVPSGQVTTPADCEHVPCEGVAELNVTPAGSVSDSWTDVALDGPAFCAVSV